MSLYFGAVTNTFSEVPGHSYSYKPGLFVEGTNEKLKLLSSSRCVPSPNCQGPYLTIILPGIPATDPISTKDTDHTDLPPILQKPLMKTLHGSIIGIQSGIRSGIVMKNDKYYRLKGCGNMYDGFPFRAISDPDRDDLVEIRGCTFEHTSSRELLYFDKINKFLTEMNLPISNKPLGWMNYEISNMPLKSIKRICCLYETFSDKRLSDHLLTGLERILPLICKIENANYFPEERLDGSSVISTSFAFQCEMKMVDIVDEVINEVIPDEVPKNVALHRRDEWKACCQILSEFKKPDGYKGSLLAYLYWTLGNEVGVIQRILSKNQISWGTYEDRLGVHCNSHANNLCVLPHGSGRFLAPLDFDMAFSKEFFDKDGKVFDEWVIMEENAQALSLGGGKINTGVREEEKIENPQLSLFRCALRDTLVLGYQNSLKGFENPHFRIPEFEKYCYALIELALMTTEDVIA